MKDHFFSMQGLPALQKHTKATAVFPCRMLFIQFLFLNLFFFWVLPQPAEGQTNTPPRFSRFLITHYNDENGLASNDIMGIAEDTRGYLWLATQFGIVRFDGKHFKLFTMSNTPSLSSNRVRSLSTDSAGAILLRDEYGIINFIEADGRIKQYPGVIYGYDFLFMSQGFLLDERSHIRNKIDSSRIRSELKIREIDISNMQFYPLGKDSAYFVSNKDISFYDQGRFTELRKISDRSLEKSFFTNGAIFLVDRYGAIWAYRNGKNFDINQSFSDLLRQEDPSFSFDIVKANFCSNKTGAFLQYGNSVYSIAYEENHLVLIPVLENLDLPLVDDIYYSSEHRLFVLRTHTNGFYLIKDQPFTVHTLNDNGGPENNFQAAVELEDGKVLTSNGILFSETTEKRIFPQGFINAKTIFKDKDNNVWYVHADSLYCANDKMRVKRAWLDPYPYAVGFTQDKNGVIWHAATQKLMKSENGNLSLVCDNPKDVVTEFVFSLNDSCLWLGTTKGLFSYKYKSPKMIAENKLANRDIRNIYRAKDGSIWLGTYGQGFYCYRNGNFYQMPLDKQGYLSVAHCFIEDENGFFWISTNKGLFQVLKKDLDAFVENKTKTVFYAYYDKSDGLKTNEFNGGCSPVAIRLHDGTFSFPSLNGLVWFKPNKMRVHLPDRKIYIDEISVDTQQIVYRDKLEFEAGARQINFSISSPYFGNEENLMMEYRIGNDNVNWIIVPPDNNIVINYLPAGDYTLEIRKRAGFGIDNYTVLTQQFSVLPFFYETSWFKILMLLFLITGLYLLFRRRLKYLNERKQKLELLVQQRTEELNSSVRQLEQTVAELKISEENLHKSNLLKDKLTSVVLHDLRSPLRFVNLLVNQMHQAVSSGETKQYMPLIIELKRASNDLSQFTQEFLVWLTSQQAGFKIKNEYVSIKEVFTETEEFFKNMLYWRNNKFSIDLKENVSVWTDRQLLKIVLHNLVDNANKHTESGTIQLGACRENGELILKIEDSGKGMSSDALKELQQRLRDNTDHYITEGAGSLGYRIVKDFITKLNGNISVDSVYQKGTSVTIRLPQ